MTRIRLAALLALAALLLAMLAAPAAARRLDHAPTGGAPFTVELGVGEEPHEVVSDGSGVARLTLNPGQELVCFELEWQNLTSPAIGAHIHVGESGAAGPIVVGFTDTTFVDPGELPMAGCVDADRETILDILRNPEGYYVNVHTTTYMPGEIRGQLSRQER